MGALTIDELKTLRGKIVSSIADNPDAIAADDSLEYGAVLELIQATGRTDLFNIALEKVNAIEDASAKTKAWIEILDAVEIEISFGDAVLSEQETTLDGVASDATNTLPPSEQQNGGNNQDDYGVENGQNTENNDQQY